MKELNTYSTQLIRELIIPKLTKEVNTSKRYAALRQVFFSLVMARWFKEKFNREPKTEHRTPKTEQINLIRLIDSGDLTNLTSKSPWSKSFYFNEYQKSFEKGEYNLKEQVPTPYGQVIRNYVSGGIKDLMVPPTGGYNKQSDSPLKVGDFLSWMIKENIRSTFILGKGLGGPLRLFSGIQDSLDGVFARVLISNEEATAIVNEFKNTVANIFEQHHNQGSITAGADKEKFENIFRKKYLTPKEAIQDIRKAYDWIKGTLTFGPLFRSSNLRPTEQDERATINMGYIQAEDRIYALAGSSPLSIDDYNNELQEKIGAFEEKVLGWRTYLSSLRLVSKLDTEETNLNEALIDYFNQVKSAIEQINSDESLAKAIEKAISNLSKIKEENELLKLGSYENIKQHIEDFRQTLDSLQKRIGKNKELEEAKKSMGEIVRLLSMPEGDKEKQIIETTKKEISDFFDKYRYRFNALDSGKIANWIARLRIAKSNTEQFEFFDDIFGKGERQEGQVSIMLNRYDGTEEAKIEWDGLRKEYERRLLFLKNLNDAKTQDPSKDGEKGISVASPFTKGGIDFRQMNMLIQPMGTFRNLNLSLPTLSSSALQRIDLDQELASLRQLASSGIVPSGERVKEYLAACFQKGRMPEKQDELFVSLVEIYRLLEDEVKEASSSLKESLIIADTGRFVLLPNNQKVGVN